MPRKTVTFEAKLFKAIQRERGVLLMEGVEKNFTEIVNDLCKKGLRHYDFRKGESKS